MLYLFINFTFNILFLFILNIIFHLNENQKDELPRSYHMKIIELLLLLLLHKGVFSSSLVHDHFKNIKYFKQESILRDFEDFKSARVNGNTGTDGPSLMEIFFKWGDVGKFDFYGHELPPPDYSLGKSDKICLATSNENEHFRRFVGLLLRFESNEHVDMNLKPLNELLYKSHSESGFLMEVTNKIDFAAVACGNMKISLSGSEGYWSGSGVKEGNLAVKTQTFFSLLYLDMETDVGALQVSELVVVDLLRVLFPRLLTSYLGSRLDAAVLLLFRFLVNVPNLEWHWDYFVDFYRLLCLFAGEEIFLKGLFVVVDDVWSVVPCRRGLLSDLLERSVQGNLVYSLEAFYAQGILDFSDDSSVFDLISSTHSTDYLFIRFFSVFEKANATALHYIFTHAPAKLSILFRFARLGLLDCSVDWSVGEFGEFGDGDGRTLFWRLLILVSGVNSDFSRDGFEMESFLFRRLFLELNTLLLPLSLSSLKLPLTHRNPDRDILDECLLNVSSVRSMIFYFSITPVDLYLVDYFDRIANEGVMEMEGFKATLKYLLSCVNETNASGLEAFLVRLISILAPLPPPLPDAPRTRSKARSLSSELLKSFIGSKKKNTDIANGSDTRDIANGSDIPIPSAMKQSSSCNSININGSKAVIILGNEPLRWLCSAAKRAQLHNKQPFEEICRVYLFSKSEQE
jgi:hypothetical protein